MIQKSSRFFILSLAFIFSQHCKLFSSEQNNQYSDRIVPYVHGISFPWQQQRKQSSHCKLGTKGEQPTDQDVADFIYVHNELHKDFDQRDKETKKFAEEITSYVRTMEMGKSYSPGGVTGFVLAENFAQRWLQISIAAMLCRQGIKVMAPKTLTSKQLMQYSILAGGPGACWYTFKEMGIPSIKQTIEHAREEHREKTINAICYEDPSLFRGGVRLLLSQPSHQEYLTNHAERFARGKQAEVMGYDPNIVAESAPCGSDEIPSYTNIARTNNQLAIQYKAGNIADREFAEEVASIKTKQKRRKKVKHRQLLNEQAPEKTCLFL